MKLLQKYQFSAWESNEDRESGNPPFLTRVFDDPTAMKVFRGAHHYDNKNKYPDYVSDYDVFYE